MPEAVLELVVYRDVEGREPFQVWFDELDRQAAAKVAVVLARMTQGNLSEIKSVGAGVLERRIDWGPGYRVYLGRDGERLVILLGGGTKKRQRRDIEDAQGRWVDYKQRKNGKEAAG
jgi:putative addiction module killer protein